MVRDLVRNRDYHCSESEGGAWRTGNCSLRLVLSPSEVESGDGGEVLIRDLLTPTCIVAWPMETGSGTVFFCSPGGSRPWCAPPRDGNRTDPRFPVSTGNEMEKKN